MRQPDLAILGATPGEIFPLAAAFSQTGTLELAGNSFARFDYRGLALLVGTTGIGKVNAAAVTAAVLCRFGPRTIWNAGCAGAYHGGGLRIGDVFISRECLCGDEGVLQTGGIVPSGHIGIPLLPNGDHPVYDRLPVAPLTTVESVLPEGKYRLDRQNCLQPCRDAAFRNDCFAVKYGSSLTVGMVSGDAATADARFRHHGAIAENMEGSAVAQVCRLFDAAFLECRGISNHAGNRDKASWNFEAALVRSHAVIRYLLDNLAVVRNQA